MRERNLLMANAGKRFFIKEKKLLRAFFFQSLFIDKRKNKKNYTDNYQRATCQNDSHFSSCFLLKYTPRQNITIKAHQIIRMINLGNFLKNSLANKAAIMIFEKSKNVFAMLSLWFSSSNFFTFNILTRRKKSVKEAH